MATDDRTANHDRSAPDAPVEDVLQQLDVALDALSGRARAWRGDSRDYLAYELQFVVRRRDAAGADDIADDIADTRARQRQAAHCAVLISALDRAWRERLARIARRRRDAGRGHLSATPRAATARPDDTRTLVMSPLPEDTLQEMRLAPSAAFASPAAVATDGRLSRQQKIDILSAWAHDCREQAVADGEGMPPDGDNAGAALKAVEDALATLERDAETTTIRNSEETPA